MKQIFKILFVLVLLIGMFPATIGLAHPPNPPEELGYPSTLPPEGKPDIESVLSQLISVYETDGLDAAKAFGLQRGMVLEDDRVQVVLVSTNEAHMDALVNAVIQSGGEL